MWVMINNAFVSAVAHKFGPDLLMVRARVKGDLERVFGQDVKVERTPRGDYLYRTTVSKAAFDAALSRAVDEIDYENFKNSVAEKDRHDAYLRCWTAMIALQDQREDTRNERYAQNYAQDRGLLGLRAARPKKVRGKRGGHKNGGLGGKPEPAHT